MTDEPTAPGGQAVGFPADAGPQPAGPAAQPADVEPTGDAAVDAAVRAVAQAAGSSPADQLPAYEAAHRTLREALARIDEG